MEFRQLPLNEDLQKGLDEAGYLTCMPVQEKVFEHSFSGKDIYAQSQTGTGKTAAFLISMYHRMLSTSSERNRKALILAPTRELAVQIENEAKKLGKYCPISTGAFYGGVGYGPQVDMLRDDVQVIIGTPGRIIDLIQQGKMLLREVGFLVIDEADRMFDMGFIDDLRKLIRYLPPPKERQTFLFSATLNVRVKNLAWEYMNDPAEIVIEAEQVTVDLVTQELYHVGSDEKFRVLLGILAREKPTSCLIFCNQKYMAEEVARRLKMNGIDCEFIMGDLPQKKRLEVIEKLKAGKVEYLVATDVAARGLDVDALDLVVNYDLPMDPESYVHRIGRTARAGKAGKAISLACEKFVYGLSAIEKYIEAKIPTVAFDESLIAEDKSSGVRFGRSRSDDGRREHGQREHDRGRGGLDRQGVNRGRRDGRSSNRSDDKFRRPPSTIRPIQRSIAEAAGQSVENFPEEARELRKPAQNPRPPADRKAQGDKRDGAKQPPRPQGERHPGDRHPGDRPQARRQDGARQDGARQDGARPEESRAPNGNPYDMSMEERMKRYKEKYAEGGKSGGSGKRQSGEPPRQGGQRGPNQAKQPQGEKPRNAQAPKGGQRPAPGQKTSKPPKASAGNNAAGRGNPPPRSNTAARGNAPSPKQPERKPGLLDRIKGIFSGKKKKE